MFLESLTSSNWSSPHWDGAPFSFMARALGPGSNIGADQQLHAPIVKMREVHAVAGSTLYRLLVAEL